MSWDDPTAGLAGERNGTGTDAAFVWRPLPEPDRYCWLTVAGEPSRLLLPAAHPLAGRDPIAFADLLDEPFLALPASAGPLRDHWLATDARGGRPAVIGAEIASSDETLEALIAGLGVCLVAAGNAGLYRHDGVVVRDLTGVGPSELVLAWRRDDHRPLLHRFVDAARATVPGG